jgi:hypothetical protein
MCELAPQKTKIPSTNKVVSSHEHENPNISTNALIFSEKAAPKLIINPIIGRG